MKRFLVVFVCVFTFVLLPIRAFADLAGDVARRYNALKSWAADFEQTTFVEMLGQTVSKKGKIAVARPNKLRIEYLTKPFKIYASNGKRLWVYRRDSKTAYLFDKPEKVISKEAWTFLGGLKNLTSIFDIMEGLTEPEGLLKIKSRRLKKLTLVPKNRDAAVLRLTLGVEPKELTVKEAVLVNASGNVTHYRFKNIVFNPVVSKDQFELPEKPKRKIVKQ